MRYNLFLKINAILIAFVLGSTSCDDSIDVRDVDDGNFVTSNKTLAYVVNGEGKFHSSLTEFRNNSSTKLYVALTKNASGAINGTFEYNAEVLNEFNATNNSNYELFPQELVTINESAIIEEGGRKSAPVYVEMVSDEVLDSDKSYVIPIRAKLSGGGVEWSEKGDDYLIFVKDLTNAEGCEKESGIKIISCMEINDTNPLNNLCFSLKESGKPLIDMVILFSSNINYNTETGRCYVNHNENIQHVLSNRDKYIKPLQDKGMKVILSLLGNHDRSGVANLADESARVFAQEVKRVCDAYQLDGVFFDDEYSSYETPPPPGFVTPSSSAASRLIYEVKRAMPDRLTMAYAYSRTNYLVDVDGQQPGAFTDYGLSDYLRGSDLSSNYPGMPRSNMALWSQELALNRYASVSRLTSMREDGYGTHMIFAMDPNRDNFDRQFGAMENVANLLFDDELVYDEQPFAKDW